MLSVMRRGTNGTTGKGKFLTALAAGSSVAAAASAAGIGRSSAYRWRDDPAFADAWDNAEEESIDLLEKMPPDFCIDRIDLDLQRLRT
jgi:hypothetical protein